LIDIIDDFFHSFATFSFMLLFMMLFSHDYVYVMLASFATARHTLRLIISAFDITFSLLRHAELLSMLFRVAATPFTPPS